MKVLLLLLVSFSFVACEDAFKEPPTNTATETQTPENFAKKVKNKHIDAKGSIDSNVSF